MTGDERIVTVADCRRMGYCVSGQRDWCIAHGLDFRDVVRNGLTVGYFRSVRDAVAEDIVSRIERNERGR